jgi:hypothetical protein
MIRERADVIKRMLIRQRVSVSGSLPREALSCALAENSNGSLRSRHGRRTAIRSSTMYIARFSYDVLPANRQRAIEFIRREVAGADEKGLTAKLLIPITRGQSGAALQFELELTSLDQLDQFRQRGVSSDKETSDWMHAFSEILLAPPMVEILRLDKVD